MLKNKFGITLITLVVTVIVLLVLAGVVINLSLGENGIIGKAQSAVDTYKNAQEEEKFILEQAQAIVNNRGMVMVDEDEYNQLKLMNKPNLWEANTKEYDFGDGVYGRRFVGTITVSAKSTRADTILTEGPIKTIISAGGCVNYINGDSDRGLYLGYGIQTFQADNEYFCGIFSENGTGRVRLSVAISSILTYPANLPYDIWITYTK